MFLLVLNNKAGNQVVQTFVDALVAEAEAIENIIAVMTLEGVELEGSDSLDNPASINAK